MSEALSKIPLNTPATLVALGGDRGFRRRLLELGLTPGVEIRLLNVAPLGDPLEILVRGCHLSLRRAEADSIQVSR